MADRTALQTVGNSDGVPGQHTYGSFIHNPNRLHLVHSQNSPISSQGPHPYSQSAGRLQNGYGASNNYNLSIPDMQRPGSLMYQNQSFYHPNSFHTQNSLQPVYSTRHQLVQGLHSQGTFNPANRIHNQRTQFTLGPSPLQNSVSFQGSFQQPVQVSQGYGQQNQQIQVLHSPFQTPAPSEHSRMHIGRSVQTFVPVNSQQQQYISFSAGSNAQPVPSEQTIQAQRPQQTFLPGHTQLQYNSSNTSSDAQPVPSEHSSSGTVQVQRPLQTFLPGNPQQQYSSAVTSSDANRVLSEHSSIHAQKSQQTLPVNSQQQYFSSNTSSNGHIAPCSQRNNLLSGSVHSPQTSTSSLSNIVPFSSPTQLYRIGDPFRDSTNTTSNNYNDSSVAASSASATVRITTESLQKQDRKNQSNDISNDFERIQKAGSATSHGISYSPQVHASSVNPAVCYLPPAEQKNPAPVQQPYLNNSQNLFSVLNSHQPYGVTLPKNSLHSKSHNVLSAMLQQKAGEKDVYSGNVNTLNTTSVTCDLTGVSSGDLNSYSLAPVTEYNMKQSGGTELREMYRHCSTGTDQVSTNNSVKKHQWYKYPETPAALSFQSDIEAMQADIANYTASSVISASVGLADPVESNIRGDPSENACIDTQTNCNQTNSVDAAHSSINLSGKVNTPESGYQVINKNIRPEELTVLIKQELPDHISVLESNLSIEAASVSSNSLSPRDVSSLSVTDGVYNTCSSVNEDTGTNNTSVTKDSVYKVTESSSHGTSTSILLSNNSISVDHQNTDAADLQTPIGRSGIWLPEVGTNRNITECIQLSSHSSDVSPATSSGIDRTCHGFSTLANADVIPNMHAANSESVPSLIVDSGLVKNVTLSSKKILDKVSVTGQLISNCDHPSSNYFSTTAIPSDKETRLLAKHQHGIFHAQKAVDESRLNQKAADESRLNQKAADQSRLNQKAADQSRLNQKAVDESRLNQKAVDESRLNQKAVDESRLNQKAVDESKLNQKAVDESRLNQKAVDESRLNQKAVDESKLNQKAVDKSRLTMLPVRLQNRRHTNPCVLKNSDETCKSSTLRLSTVRQSLDSNTFGQSKLRSKLQNVCDQRRGKSTSLTDSKSARKQSSSSENSLSAREKVFNMWKAGQVVKNNRTGNKLQRSGSAAVSRVTNHSEQTVKGPDLKAVATNDSIVKTKAKKSSRSCYVIIHGHKLICLKSKPEDLILLCEFQFTCFPDKALGSVNNCIDQILQIKKTPLKHPEKDKIIMFLKKCGYHTDNLIYTISVNDGRKIYHHMYGMKTCTTAMCVVKTPDAVSFVDVTVEESMLKVNKEHILEENSANKWPVTTDSMEGSKLSANEAWQSGLDSPTRQCSDDSLNSRLCIDLSRVISDSPDSDETLVYGESSGNLGDLNEVESVQDPHIISWIPGTPKIGGLFRTHFGHIRSYKHDRDTFLAVDDLCRIFYTTEFFERIEKENITLYSCCQEIESFLNALDLNFPPLKSQYQSLIREADIGVHKLDDNVHHNSGRDRSSVPKRPLCGQYGFNDSTPHKHPRLDDDALLSDSHNLMILKLEPEPSVVTQEVNCQSDHSLVEVHEHCGSCPDSIFEKTEVTRLRTEDARSKDSSEKSSQIHAVTKSISSSSAPCLNTENLPTASSDHLPDEKCVNNSKKLVQHSDNELLHMTYISIDIPAAMDNDSCCRNTDTMIDHSVIRQHDLISPDSVRSAFSPDEVSVVIFDDGSNPDALSTKLIFDNGSNSDALSTRLIFDNGSNSDILSTKCSKQALNQGSWNSRQSHSLLLVTSEDSKTLTKDTPDGCLTPAAHTEISVKYAGELDVEKADNNSCHFEATGRSLMKNTPSERNASENCFDKNVTAQVEPQTSLDNDGNISSQSANKKNTLTVIEKCSFEPKLCSDPLTKGVSGRDKMFASDSVNTEVDLSGALQLHTTVDDDGSGYEVIVLPYNKSDGVSHINSDSTRSTVKSASEVHKSTSEVHKSTSEVHGEDISDVIICDSYIVDTVSKYDKKNRDKTADVPACVKLSSEHKVVHQNTKHQLPGLESSEDGPAFLLSSSVQCKGFERCVDDMDLVTSSNTSTLVASSCRKAYAKLCQQHRALLEKLQYLILSPTHPTSAAHFVLGLPSLCDTYYKYSVLGDITRLRQRVAFFEAEKEKTDKKCKYYEDLIFDITSTFKCCDREPSS